jgi:hypothetical protein
MRADDDVDVANKGARSHRMGQRSPAVAHRTGMRPEGVPRMLAAARSPVVEHHTQEAAHLQHTHARKETYSGLAKKRCTSREGYEADLTAP